MMGVGAGFGLLGLVLMVLVWGGLIALAVWLVRALFPPAGQPPAPPTGREMNAHDILDRRLARGEISREDYDLMKETLSQ
jgi:putative membrane protein